MTDKDLILEPRTLTISFAVESTFALLNSMILMSAINEFPGLDNWLAETNRKLSPELRHQQEILFDGLYGATQVCDESLVDFRDYVDDMEAQEPGVLRDRTLDMLAHKCQKHCVAVDQEITPEELLSSYEAFENYWRSLHKESDEEIDAAFVQELYHLLNHPSEMKNLMVRFFRVMWEKYLKAEWARVKGQLYETVNALQKLNLSGLSPLEVARVVTGRDLSNTFMAESLEKANRIIFVPAPHIGPYVSMDITGDTVRVLFRPRIPEGAAGQSPALDRSELVVRLSALADDIRLRILELLAQEDQLCAQDVITQLELSQSAASRHLRQLSATGYLTERRREGAKCYSLNQERIEQTCQALKSFLGR